jgi:prepilin-type N-terminal cleavage/methylation domain-containing protein
VSGKSRTLLAKARGHTALTAQQRDRKAFTFHPLRRRHAFTLLELLVVMAVIAILLVAVAPAFTTIKSAGDITAAASTITGVLDQARNYALANNTYACVGFYEEDTTATTPTNAAPPYPGKGRVLIATVFSTDGTKIYADSDPIAQLPTDRIRQVGKLVRIEGIHITDIGAPPSPTPSPTPSSDSLDGRPDWPYTYAAGISADHFNRISSDSADTTKFAFRAQNYTFSKTVRFNPRGEANLNSTYSFKNAAEIGLVPTHGKSVPTPPPSGLPYSGNVVAIQFSAVGGNFKIYRR